MIVRRQQCAKIAMLVSFLDGADVFASPVIESLKDLLNRLSGVANEGTTREVLRNIRDSLMDGGWVNYRDREVRRVVSDILKDMARSDVVTNQQVEFYKERLWDSTPMRFSRIF